VANQLTTSAQREEAERLLALDEHGLNVESVAIALRLFAQQEKAMKAQQEVDLGTATQLQHIGSRDISPEEYLELFNV